MNLENLNVIELGAQEKLSVGGGIWQLVAAAVGYLVWESLDDFTDNMENAQNGYEDATN